MRINVESSGQWLNVLGVIHCEGPRLPKYYAWTLPHITTRVFATRGGHYKLWFYPWWQGNVPRKRCQAKELLHDPLHDSWSLPRAVGRIVGCLSLVGVLHDWGGYWMKDQGHHHELWCLIQSVKVGVKHTSLKGGKATFPICCLHDNKLHHNVWSSTRIGRGSVVMPWPHEGLESKRSYWLIGPRVTPRVVIPFMNHLGGPEPGWGCSISG